MIPTTKKTRILAGALLVAALTLTAGPAYASIGSGHKDSAACWMNADTGVEQCFDSAAKMADAMVTQTGGSLVREGSEQTHPTGARVLFLVAELFTGTGFGGSVLQVTSGTSSLCLSSSTANSLTGIYNNSVSSFRSYFGCTTRIWDLTGQAGANYGPFVSASSVASLDDRASSYRVE